MTSYLRFTHRLALASHRCGHRQRVGARFSNPAGAHRRPVYSERRYRHHSAPDRTLAVGATTFIIDNRPGAGANIGTEAVVRAPPDGYPLLLESTSNAINATLYDKLNFDVLTGVVPVAGIMRTPLVMLVHPSFPAKTVPEFIAYAKANPGKVNMASPGIGSPHVSGELFNMMADVKLVHIPYRVTGSAFTDLVAGQVEVMFGGAASPRRRPRPLKSSASSIRKSTLDSLTPI
jgi:hypothetical protein